jgi:hypothetical protein
VLEAECESRKGLVVTLGPIFLHFCVECGKYGPYGYGVELRKGKEGTWYCKEHRPDKG